MSKAFDCLPHDVLIEKMKHYKFSKNSLSLIEDYLSNRFQRVKIQSTVNVWERLTKGVPQGSIVGPLCFNLYVNDLLLLLESKDLLPSNYADDNTVTVAGNTKNAVIEKVTSTVSLLASWFKDNQMKTNIDKFQLIVLSPCVRELQTGYNPGR